MSKVVRANYPISRVVTHQAGSSMRLTWCFERNGEVLRLETGTAQQTGEYFVARRHEGEPVKTERYTRVLRIRGNRNSRSTTAWRNSSGAESMSARRPPQAISGDLFFLARCRVHAVRGAPRLTARADGDRARDRRTRGVRVLRQVARAVGRTDATSQSRWMAGAVRARRQKLIRMLSGPQAGSAALLNGDAFLMQPRTAVASVVATRSPVLRFPVRARRYTRGWRPPLLR